MDKRKPQGQKTDESCPGTEIEGRRLTAKGQGALWRVIEMFYILIAVKVT